MVEEDEGAHHAFLTEWQDATDLKASEAAAPLIYY